MIVSICASDISLTLAVARAALAASSMAAIAARGFSADSADFLIVSIIVAMLSSLGGSARETWASEQASVAARTRAAMWFITR
jgi:hypothetical protein